MPDFIIPPLEEERPVLNEKEATETAFYAASASKGDPIADFHNAKSDLQTTGESAFVNQVKNEWAQEQDAGKMAALESIMGDASIDTPTKRAILNNYRLTKGVISNDLKERYIQKTASSDAESETVHQRTSQEIIVDKLEELKTGLSITQRKANIEEDQGTMQSMMTGFGHLFSSVGNTLGLVSDEEYKEAHDNYKKSAAVNPIATGVGGVGGLLLGAAPAGVLGTGAAALTGAAAVVGFLSGTSRFAEVGQNPNVSEEDRLNTALVDAGFAAAGTALPIFKATSILAAVAKNGGGNVALGELSTMAQNEILKAYPELQQKNFDKDRMTVDMVLGGILGVAFGRQVAKPSPSIAAGSPANVTATVNPAVAAKLGAQAISNPTGGLAPAMGTDVASIANDWALPKAIDATVALENPDLARNLKEMDNEFQGVYEDYRYDPNVIDVTKREEDNDRILQVLRENTGSYYQQSNSTVAFSDELSYGVMRFGPDATSKFTTKKQADAAHKKLLTRIKQLPAEEQGDLAIIGSGKKGQGYHLEWKWKKEYDDLSNWSFGPDSIKTSFLGVDVSNVARSGLGKWLFSSGTLPRVVEQGAQRNIERAAKLENQFIKAYDEHITSSKHKKELSSLIEDAEQLGVNSFTKGEMSARFPHLNTKQVNDLFESHTYWNRLNDYAYNFNNRKLKTELINEKMNGVYNDAGDYLGPATATVSADSLKGIKTIWDYGLNQPVKFDLKQIKKDGQIIVRVKNKIKDTGSVHDFALVGKNSRLSILPERVLEKIPGYSPRRVRENFFVDITPKGMVVNGVRTTDPNAMRQHTRSVAATRNEADAESVAVQARVDNPNHDVRVRPERQDNFGDIITDYEVHSELFKNAMKRGERLPSKDGLARIEDRMVSAISMVKTLAKSEAFSQWDEGFQKNFMKSYGDYVRTEKGAFPTNKIQIVPKENMTRAEKKEFDTAHRMFEYYSKQKSFETMGDFYWKKSAHWLADVLESWKIPAGWVRDLGKTGNLLVKYPKMAATTVYIHMNPLRQWLIQPAQLLEMYAVNPHTALKNFNEMLAIRLAITDTATSMAKHVPMVRGLARSMSGMDPREFDATVKAIKDSGMLQSVDMNSLVHGVFKEVDRNLVENIPERAYRDLKQSVSAIPRAMRTVGFDAAELTNRLGLYLQAKDLWIAQNPGKNWNTKEAKEVIAFEGARLAGNMNKAGNLPYQEGALSVFFQFAAINQKLFMNLFQSGTTILTPLQRARLAATRAVLYGAKYGLPGGAVIYKFLEGSEDPAVQQGAEDLKRGVIDRAANGILKAFVEPDAAPDLAVGKSITPYSEGFLPYLDIIMETAKMIDKDPASSPRYPFVGLISSYGKTVDQIQGLVAVREPGSDEHYKEMAMEAAELVSSGYNNWAKGALAYGLGDYVSSNGNALGLQISKGEAVAKIFGISSYKEFDHHDHIKLQNEKRQGIKDTANDIYKTLQSIEGKLGTPEYDQEIRRINSLVNLLPADTFTHEDRIDIITEVLNRDRYSYTEGRTSIVAEHYKNFSSETTENERKQLGILERSSHPTTQEYVRLLKEGKL